MYSRTTIGNVEKCRTEVEIRDEFNELIAVVYEDQSGVQAYFLGDPPPSSAVELQATVESAKSALLSYVNRRGENPPDNLSVGALSLWLLEKDDGTALGITPGQFASYGQTDVASNSVKFKISQQIQSEIKSLVRDGKDLLAARLIRQVTGCSHNEARNWLSANCPKVEGKL